MVRTMTLIVEGSDTRRALNVNRSNDTEVAVESFSVIPRFVMGISSVSSRIRQQNGCYGELEGERIRIGSLVCGAE